MKILFLVIFSLLLGFVSQDVFAETEMTGWLGIMDSYSTEGGPHPYLFWFQPDDQTTPYRLNPYTLPSNILDLAGERVRVTVDDDKEVPLATSLNPNEQFLDIVSIEVIEIPEGILPTHIPPATVRSVTLLSKFMDVPGTPSEDPGESPGQFKVPTGVAVDSSGNIYVIEKGENTGNGHRVQKFDSNGDFLFKFGKSGTGNGEFLFPTGIAVDSLGNIYVLENNGERVQKFDSNGVFVLKFGSSGSGDGQFNFPFGIAVDSSDNVYVADVSNHRIQKFDPDGIFQGWLGGCTAGANCIGNQRSNGFMCTAATCTALGAGIADGQFNAPRAIAFDTSGNIYVVQSANDRIQKFDSSGGFLLKHVGSGSGEGQFLDPHGIAADMNNVYVADTGNHRIQKFNTSLVFDSMWGWGVQDGSPAFQTCTSSCEGGIAGSGVGQLDSPEGIASGSTFVADANNDRVKKFDVDGVFLSELGTVPDLLHDSAYYEDIFYTDAGSLKNYYDVSSYGHFIWDGSVDDWKNLPSNQATYSNNFNLMITDAIAAHETTVDFCNPDPVTNLILIFNGPVSPTMNSAFGSFGTFGAPWPTVDICSNITISVSWHPDNGGFFCCGQTLDRGIGVAAHELGHNLTFEHTPPPPGVWINESPPGPVPHNEPYHDPNSVMSTNRDLEAPSALITPQRRDAGWMAPGNIMTVPDGTSATITLDFSNESDLGPNPQMVTVPLPDGTFYHIEGHKDGLFNDTPLDLTGAIIYREFPSGNQYAYLTFTPADMDAKYSLVATAGTDSFSQLDQAILEVGETFVDVANSVTVTTQSISNSVTVFVSNNVVDTCTPPPGQNWVISENCTLTGDVTADMNITVQDSSVLTIPDGFIVFFDPATFSITIISGSGILVQQGGSIQTIPP